MLHIVLHIWTYGNTPIKKCGSVTLQPYNNTHFLLKINEHYNPVCVVDVPRKNHLVTVVTIWSHVQTCVIHSKYHHKDITITYQNGKMATINQMAAAKG